jgi:hypothetical protein
MSREGHKKWELTSDALKDLLTGDHKFCKEGKLYFDEIHFSEKEGIQIFYMGTMVAFFDMYKGISLARGDTVILQRFLGTMEITPT